jgi:peptidoglycan/xylan/chitin deacetylase (PgdA/CDA1 family)
VKRLLKLIPYKSIPVLLYHRIAATPPKEDPLRLAVPPEVFEAQMEYLRSRGFTTVSLDDLAGQTEKEKKVQAKKIAITFDDGYLDNYTHAFPILQDYGFAATVFIVTDFLGKMSYWDPSLTPLMNWEHVKEMSRYGMSFQSHTCSHRDLTALTDEEVKRELLDSRRQIEDKLGFRAHSIAYPFGNFNENVIRLAKIADYQSGWAAGLANDERFSFERFQIKAKQGKFSFSLLGNGWGRYFRRVRYFRL